MTKKKKFLIIFFSIYSVFIIIGFVGLSLLQRGKENYFNSTNWNISKEKFIEKFFKPFHKEFDEKLIDSQMYQSEIINENRKKIMYLSENQNITFSFNNGNNFCYLIVLLVTFSENENQLYLENYYEKIDNIITTFAKGSFFDYTIEESLIVDTLNNKHKHFNETRWTTGYDFCIVEGVNGYYSSIEIKAFLIGKE